MFERDFLERIKYMMSQDDKRRVGPTGGRDSATFLYDLNSLENNIQANNYLWDIPAGDVIVSHRPKVGRFIILIKKIIRKILFWTVTKPLLQQREFNGSVTRSINEMSSLLKIVLSGQQMLEQQQRLTEEYKNKFDGLSRDYEQLNNKFDNLSRDYEQLNNKVADLQEEVTELQENEKKRESFPIDYRKFENEFRGDERWIREQQIEVYNPFLSGKKKLLDLGCGRGELISAFRELGMEVSGVDINSDLVSYARKKGLNVFEGDILNYLQQNSTEKYDAITCLHVIEHLYPGTIVELVQAAYDNLNEDGIVIFETPNPESLYNLAYGFTIDMTHKKPVHSYTMKFLLSEAGFTDIIVKHLSPADPSISLEHYKDNKVIRENFEKIDKLLYGYHNYAIIGRKKIK